MDPSTPLSGPLRSAAPPSATHDGTRQDKALRQAAKDLEASFLAETA